MSGLRKSGLRNMKTVERKTNITNEDARLHLMEGGVGIPVIVTDGMRNWPARGFVDEDDPQGATGEVMTFDTLQRDYGADTVIVNDRAPARHADKHVEGVNQRSVQVPLAAYVGMPRSSLI